MFFAWHEKACLIAGFFIGR